jgi:hypothetical protein
MEEKELVLEQKDVLAALNTMLNAEGWDVSEMDLDRQIVCKIVKRAEQRTSEASSERLSQVEGRRVTYS